jgi:hypothetical protein
MTRSGVRSGLLLLLLVCLSVGCATTAFPRGEYRRGQFLHREYSIQIPDGWDGVTPKIIELLGRNVASLPDDQRSKATRELRVLTEEYDAAFVSRHGALILVRSFPNLDGIQLPTRAFTEKEWDARLVKAKESIVRDMSKEGLTVESVELVEYGPRLAISARLRLPERGRLMRMVLFAGPGRFVGVLHAGTATNADEGLSGFEEAARSVRFE